VLFSCKVDSGIETDVGSESALLEQNPTPFTCESDLGTWLSTTAPGAPGKGQLFLSASSAGTLPKATEPSEKGRLSCIQLLPKFRK